ncbi:hypothetical protein BURPSS13_P0474 [Burkholderia pseudomallei S13]|nr:hypothetical protein BURPSS13_P0474 [Burkholderia pseudomallei S13]
MTPARQDRHACHRACHARPVRRAPDLRLPCGEHVSRRFVDTTQLATPAE